MKNLLIWSLAIWSIYKRGLVPDRVARNLWQSGLGLVSIRVPERNDIAAGVSLTGLSEFRTWTQVKRLLTERIDRAAYNIHAHLDSVYSAEIAQCR